MSANKISGDVNKWKAKRLLNVSLDRKTAELIISVLLMIHLNADILQFTSTGYCKTLTLIGTVIYGHFIQCRTSHDSE